MKTEDLLQKYVSKGLSKDERFELEKRALEDDFLADAWEGLQLHQGSDLHQQWKAIQSQWNNRTKVTPKKETKIVAMSSWIRYAAAAAVLLLGAALFFMRSDDVLSTEESIVALNPIEIVENQEDLTASESVAVITDLEKREKIEEEKRIQEKAKKIMPLSKISKAQTPTPQKNKDVTSVTATQPEIISNQTHNSLVGAAPSPISNPEPKAEGRAAIPIDKEVEDFGNVAIRNTDEIPIIAKIENPDRDRQKSSSLFDPSKKTSDNDGVKLSLLKEGKKLPTPNKETYPTVSSPEGLKKNILDNSKFANANNQTQSSLRRASDLFLKDKDYEGARDEALRVLALNSNLAEGNELIGDIYAAASYTCGADSWGHSLAVLAAYDQYNKANSMNTKASVARQLKNKMDELQDRFPTKDEGFMRGAKPGESVKVPCWIGETVKIRFK